MPQRVWDALKTDHKFWATVIIQMAATIWFAASVRADVKHLAIDQANLRQDVKEIRTFIMETNK